MRGNLRIVVTGGRNYQDAEGVWEVLNLLRPLEVAHGKCPTGVDSFTADWCRMSGTPVQEFPANWERYGRSAGPLRNTTMLFQFKPNLVVVFPGGAGTRSCLEYAKKYLLPVVLVGRE